MRRLSVLLSLVLIFLLPSAHAQKSFGTPDWTAPLAPFRIADNLFYVGSRDLASYLITTPAGNILINASLESSPALIRASVEKLGFHWADTKILLNGQAHFDHVAGAAQVIRETHARNIVMEYDADVMRSGGASDFARQTDGLTPYPSTPVDRVLRDGDTVSLGDPKHGGVVLTAHRTGGHTRGCTTWTFRTHVPGDAPGKLRDVVILGGFAPLSGYRLVATPGHPASYPGIADDFTHTFATLRALPCDIFLGAHGAYFNMLPKLARMPQEGERVWIDPTGYQHTIDEAQRSFEANLARQRAQSGAAHGG
ncbi:MAG TPA: subclass B3 metallo-beta-lactamase [Acidobacteriaceae bacterium]|nr:subclass B3 metallo-beta-lactamase [Acidobacteriaceae bacterium]